MKIVWVIGENGLLGSSLCEWIGTRGDALFHLDGRLRWADPQILLAQLETAVGQFAAQAGNAESWEIYWAAGIGTMASPDEVLVRETEALRAVLGFIGAQEKLMRIPGRIAFASSAGAIYAGHKDGVIDETTPVAPTTSYAHAKLRQEELLTAFADARPDIHLLLARISTIYGARQSLAKQQGLLSGIARSIVRNQAIQVYVPLDTIRDYITAKDAAAYMISSLRGLQARRPRAIKIIASENPTTVAEIVATFKRVARRTPKIVTSANQSTALYGRIVQFRSTDTRDPAVPSTSLLIGIAQLLQAERTNFMRSAKG